MIYVNIYIYESILISFILIIISIAYLLKYFGIFSWPYIYDMDDTKEKVLKILYII